MPKLLKYALVGALALSGVAATALSASAMPVGGLALTGSDAGAATSVEQVRWVGHYGWRRHYGFRRAWHPAWHRGWHRRWR